MVALGFSGPYPMIFFGPQRWGDPEEIAAYYAPLVARGVFKTEELRDGYVNELCDKFAARRELDLDAFEDACDEAWARADVIRLGAVSKISA